MARLVGLVCIIIFIFSSCNRPGSRSTQSESVRKACIQLRVKAEQISDSQPDNALLYADSAIRLLINTGYNDTVIIALMRIKAQSWLNKGNSDSAISILLRARTIAIKGSDHAGIF